jgi:hypothetical protein
LIGKQETDTVSTPARKITTGDLEFWSSTARLWKDKIVWGSFDWSQAVILLVGEVERLRQREKLATEALLRTYQSGADYAGGIAAQALRDLDITVPREPD